MYKIIYTVRNHSNLYYTCSYVVIDDEGLIAAKGDIDANLDRDFSFEDNLSDVVKLICENAHIEYHLIEESCCI